MAKDKKNLRRNYEEGYEFKDGHMHGAYKVYDDGRIFVHNGLHDSWAGINNRNAALHEFKRWMADYVMSQQVELQRNITDFWHAAERDLSKIAPVPNPEDFTLSYDLKTRELKRTAKEKPVAPEPEAAS